MKYKINLVRKVWESATVHVEAESPEAAESQALALAHEGVPEWEYCHASVEPAEVIDCEEVKP